MARGAKQTLVGLDLNATRARAAEGTPGMAARPLALDGAHADLPLALSLEGRAAVVGRAGLALCRRLPHLACLNFLPCLGEPRTWAAGRHRLDAARALALVLERLQAACAGAQASVVVVPSYLGAAQVETLVCLAEKARLPVHGWLSAPLAAALAAAAEERWSGPALVADVDDHALTWSAVSATAAEVRLLDTQSLPRLGTRVWRERLLDAVADRCVRQSRRDPRASADAEQGLYDQLDGVLDACRRGQAAEVLVQMAHWGQNLFLRPDEAAACCAPLVRQALAALHALCGSLPPGGTPPVILVTDAAGRLPGLVAALEETVGEVIPAAPVVADGEDFGAALLDDEPEERRGVAVLAADAPARAACDLAGRLLRGELPRGAVTSAPLPPPVFAEAGPARLQFRGQDFVLGGKAFVLGRTPDCHLVLDSDQYPTVSSRHCEIVYERRTYVLRDRSRNGTLVNERPVIHEIVLQAGDWIRLGPGGPMVRFLGQAADQLRLITTA